MIEKNHPKLFFLDKEKAAIPIDGICNVWINQWWIVCPERGLTFYKQGPDGAPQCNTDRRVTEMIQKSQYPWATIEKVPIAYKRSTVAYE